MTFIFIEKIQVHFFQIKIKIHLTLIKFLRVYDTYSSEYNNNISTYILDWGKRNPLFLSEIQDFI